MRSGSPSQPAASVRPGAMPSLVLGVALGALALTAHALAGLGEPVPPSDSYPFSTVLQRHFGARTMWALLALGAFAVAWRRPLRVRWLAIGSVAPFPLALVAEVVRDATSHNLLPFEVALWAAAAAPAALGALLARRLGGAAR